MLVRCVAGGSPPPPPPPPPPTGGLVINEVDYDQVGADGDGFVELKEHGLDSIDLAEIALVYVDGADSEERERSRALAPGDYLVAAGDAQNMFRPRRPGLDRRRRSPPGRSPTRAASPQP